MRECVQANDSRGTQHAAARITWVACALWMGGCVATGRVQPPATSASASTSGPAAVSDVTPAAPTEQAATVPDNPVPSGEPAAPVPQGAQPTAAPPERPAVVVAHRPKPSPAAAGSTTAQPAAKDKQPAAEAAPPSKPEAPVATQSASSATEPGAVATQAAPAPAPPAAAPPLDLTALKQRLRDTSAIGVFTKLALKNQVDDLLAKFRGFYGGQVKTTLPQLRQSYDLLVLKVLALLQDSDPLLAKEIIASREVIWGLLADPQKFATLSIRAEKYCEQKSIQCALDGGYDDGQRTVGAWRRAIRG
jgi:hypothetical protein